MENLEKKNRNECVYVHVGVSEETGMGQNILKEAGGTKDKSSFPYYSRFLH